MRIMIKNQILISLISLSNLDLAVETLYWGMDMSLYGLIGEVSCWELE